jgi:hypothetical protein
MANRTGKQRGFRLQRGKFSPAAHLQYLNVAALERTKKAVVEIGSISAGDRVIPLAAEVHRGQVVALRPVACKGCKPDGRRGLAGTARKEALKVALRRARESKRPSIRLPMPVSRLIGAKQRIRAIINDFDIHCYFWDCCIFITDDDGWTCAYCIRSGPGICIGPVVIINK